MVFVSPLSKNFLKDLKKNGCIFCLDLNRNYVVDLNYATAPLRLNVVINKRLSSSKCWNRAAGRVVNKFRHEICRFFPVA